MRRATLIPLAVAVSAVMSCGMEAKDEAALAVPERDLTLATAAPQVEVASPVELGRVRAQPRTELRLPAARRPAHRPKARSKAEPAVAVAPAIVPSPAAPVARFTNTAYEPVNDRELPPGQTVTVIPASSGASSGEQAGEFPDLGTTSRGWGGGSGMGGPGRCPRPGPGIGIAVRPRPALY